MSRAVLVAGGLALALGGCVLPTERYLTLRGQDAAADGGSADADPLPSSDGSGGNRGSAADSAPSGSPHPALDSGLGRHPHDDAAIPPAQDATALLLDATPTRPDSTPGPVDAATHGPDGAIDRPDAPAPTADCGQGAYAATTNACYEAFSEALTWQDAEARCQQ